MYLFRDASWELEGDQFGDLMERHGTCDALMCLCPTGREVDDEDT
jgi:hypothetical protein